METYFYGFTFPLTSNNRSVNVSHSKWNKFVSNWQTRSVCRSPIFPIKGQFVVSFPISFWCSAGQITQATFQTFDWRLPKQRQRLTVYGMLEMVLACFPFPERSAKWIAHDKGVFCQICNDDLVSVHAIRSIGGNMFAGSRPIRLKRKRRELKGNKIEMYLIPLRISTKHYLRTVQTVIQCKYWVEIDAVALREPFWLHSPREGETSKGKEFNR